MNHNIKPGVATGDQVQEIFKLAKQKKFALPAVNVIGSSSINGLIYIRGQHKNFDDWAALGNTGWSFNDVLPYFRKLECFNGAASQFHGHHGELQVSELRNSHPYCNAWLDAAKQYG